jgi:N-acetylglutamate synthase-like GNAT family acetyltransferase
VSEPSVRSAGPEDLPAIEALIASEQLPGFQTADFIDTFWVAEAAGRLVGCCGLELYGDAGLLRSAVVTGDYRGTGLGAQLAQRVIGGAKELGVRDLYLFTMNAAGFFEHLGFERCTFDDFSKSGRRSTQWRALSERPDIAAMLTAMRMRP